MTHDEKRELVGDYVLGLMEPDERELFEQDLEVDPELAEMANRFAGRMASLDASAPAVPVNSRLWNNIAAIIESAPQETAPNVVPLTPALRGNRTPTLPWWTALAASVVLSLGIGFLAGRTLTPAARPTVIAVLLNEGTTEPAVIIEAFADDSVHLTPLEDLEVPEGRILQVWTLPDPETGPVSLGTLSASQDIRLAGPELPLPQSGQLYEITLEPAPGSPTGRPTGPVLVKGFAKPPV